MEPCVFCVKNGFLGFSKRNLAAGMKTVNIYRRHLTLTSVLLLCCTFTDHPVNCLPVLSGGVRDERASGGQYYPLPDSMTYLSKFGYLPQSDIETLAQRNKSELAKAIKSFQRMAHLPVTGKFDTATTSKMTEPRCGVSDDVYGHSEEDGRSRSKRYVLGPSKWPHTDISFRILNYSPDMHVSVLRDALQRAFRVWSDVTTLTFREVSQGDADMFIRFSRMYHHDGYPFDGPGMTLAHAFFPGPDSGGDVHFDEDEEWTENTDRGVNLFIVAAHEMGHALGLGHSSTLNSLMYPWYQGYTPHFQLQSDDLAAIQTLYGSAPHRPTRPHAGTTVPTGTTQSTPSVPPGFTTQPTQPPTTPNWGPNSPPDHCSTSIDAAAIIRQEIYMFKGLWFWRIDRNGVMKDYPVEVNRFWYNFPEHITKFDAVYERVKDGKIVFFSGKRFWLFSGNHMVKPFPKEGKPLTQIGLPEDIVRVDAAFVWGYNLKTYLITGSMYWRYNEELAHMDFDYPRDMTMWDGVPLPVDAAFKAWDGVTYFLRGSNFWRFKDSLMSVETKSPSPIGPYWLQCEETLRDTNAAPPSYNYLPLIPLLSLICVVMLNHTSS